MKHIYQNTPIENFLPHRKPMLLLDELIQVDEHGYEARYTVKEDCIFLKADGTLEPVALMEIMAQCFAAGNGITNPLNFGMLAAMRGMVVKGTARLHDELHAKVILSAQLGDIMVVEGRLFRGDECILEGQFKIFAPSSNEQ